MAYLMSSTSSSEPHFVPRLPEPTGGRFILWIVLLGVLTAVAPLSIDMYLPSFVQVEQDLRAPAGSMEWTLSTFFIGLTLGQLIYGPVSDRFGRKLPLYVGFSLYTLASVGCALADNITMLWVCRFLQGMGGCAGLVIPSAIVRDRMGPSQSARIFSLLMLVMGLAPILAPLVGGWLLQWAGWRAIFGLLVLFGLLCLLGLGLGLEESHDTTHEPPLQWRTVARNYAGLLRDRSFMGFVLSAGLIRAGMFAYIAGSPFVLMQLYGISPQNYGWFFGANAFGLIAASQLNAYWLKTVPASTLLRRALWLPVLAGLALAVLALAGWMSLPWFVLGCFVFMTSVGVIGPNASACALASQGRRAGTAAAFNGASAFLFATVAGALVGGLHNGSSQPLAVVMAVCGLGAWCSYRALCHTGSGAVKA